MPDDGGVLGNLPRSRPGQRSEKRAGPKAASPPRQAQRRSTARPKPAAGSRQAAGAAAGEDRPKAAAESGGDPLEGAIRGAVGIAATGARVAGGVARELLRRIPRP